MYVALKIDKIEFYLCVEKQVSCTRMEGEKGLGTDISKTPIRPPHGGRLHRGLQRLQLGT